MHTFHIKAPAQPELREAKLLRSVGEFAERVYCPLMRHTVAQQILNETAHTSELFSIHVCNAQVSVADGFAAMTLSQTRNAI